MKNIFKKKGVVEKARTFFFVSVDVKPSVNFFFFFFFLLSMLPCLFKAALLTQSSALVALKALSLVTSYKGLSEELCT